MVTVERRLDGVREAGLKLIDDPLKPRQAYAKGEALFSAYI